VNELWGDQRRWLECAKRDLSKSSVVAPQQGKPWFPPSAGQENMAEVAMLSMRMHARQETSRKVIPSSNRSCSRSRHRTNHYEGFGPNSLAIIDQSA